MDGKFSVCILLYGNYPKLAERCLNSIWASLPEGGNYIQDIRIATNNCSYTTRHFVKTWVGAATPEFKIPIIWYGTSANVFKYPLMRKMILEDEIEPGELVMWFDDDSYLTYEHGWWERVLQATKGHDMIGQNWSQPVQGRQWDWVITQSWYNPKVGKPRIIRGRRSFEFCQGAWWVIKTSVLRKYDWPTKTVQHCGGDSMLGELFRHQKLKRGKFDLGVRINADDKGKHSGARRRGHSESVVGKHFKGLEKNLPNHDFFIARTLHSIA